MTTVNLPANCPLSGEPVSCPLTSPDEPFPVLNSPKTVYFSDPGSTPLDTSSKNSVMSAGTVGAGVKVM